MTDKTLSYAITACNEHKELKFLLDTLIMNKRDVDEIVVLLDETNYTSDVEELVKLKSKDTDLKYFVYPLNSHFGNFKTKLNSYCSNDYIFQIDADEIPSTNLINNITKIINDNDIDLYAIPRLNVLKPINEETFAYIKEVGWNLSYHEEYYINIPIKRVSSEFYNIIKENNLLKKEDHYIFTYYVPIINFPDYQGRLYKNRDDIQWVGKVHEKIQGHNTFFYLPTNTINYCLTHVKNITKQKQQNEFYKTL